MPTCRIHGTDMPVSKFGGYYCPQLMEDGETRCKERIRQPRPTSIAAPATQPSPKSAVDSDAVLAAAALNFAASLVRGAGPEMADEGIAVAIKAYQAMKAVA